MSEFVARLLEWSTAVVDTVGAAGLGLVLLLESLFPPLPSEPFLLAAGLASANGSGSALVAILSAATGMTVGATIWFYAARLIPAERVSLLVDRYGRFLLIRPGHLSRTVARFDRRRRVAVFSGRFLPVGRMLVSIPAGRSGMPLPEFLAATFLGSLVWSGLLIGLGRVVGERQHLAVAVLGHYTQTVLVLACTVLLALPALALIRRRRQRAWPWAGQTAEEVAADPGGRLRSVVDAALRHAAPVLSLRLARVAAGRVRRSTRTASQIPRGDRCSTTATTQASS